jgi:hypothetical protein
MQEKPLERLNYYNGMAVDAAGFKTEQEYHIRVRRWLNKSLYSAGIASGLEIKGSLTAPIVTVSPGLALDSEGREIILLDQTDVEVCSYSGTDLSTVVGNYLVIEYGEEAIAYEPGSCAVRQPMPRTTQCRTNGGGGPSRVQANPKFSWVPFVPLPGANQIVLGRVELNNGCTAVSQIDAGPRRYIGAASAATVRQYALEGEREVACLPGTSVGKSTVYFHIRGRMPNSITLYLRAEKLSILHYTETGHHKHSLDIQLAGADGMHRHDIGKHDTSSDPIAADLGLLEQADSDDFAQVALDVATGGLAAVFVSHSRTETGTKLAATPIYHYKWTFAGATVKEGDYPATTPGAAFPHPHTVGGTGTAADLTKDNDDNSKHTHQFQSTAAEYSGILSNPSPTAAVNPAYMSRAESPLTYFSNLLIAIDGIDRTDAIIAQIVDHVASDKLKWQNGLGDGTETHPIADKSVDTVPIRLDFLPGVTFAEGQHVIEFTVGLLPSGDANGGRLIYNLYVE